MIFTNPSHGLSQQQLEMLEEKLFLLKHYDGIYMCVVFADIPGNSLYTGPVANLFAKNVIEAAHRLEPALASAKLIVVALPSSKLRIDTLEVFNVMHDGGLCTIGEFQVTTR